VNIRTAIEDYLTVHALENHSHWTIDHTRERLYWFADWLETVHGITDTDRLLVVHMRCLGRSLTAEAIYEDR